jgi:hypothetical protein
MAGVKPGPVCTIRDGIDFIDSGTLTRWRSEEPAPVGAGSLSSLSPMLTNVAAKSAPAGIDLTRLGVTDQSIREHDNQFTGRIGGRFKQLVETAARRSILIPACLPQFCLLKQSEPTTSNTARRKMDTFTIGLDDFWDRKKRFWLTIPASREVGIYNKTVEDENEVGRKVTTAYLRAEDAVLASAVYLKDGENRVRDIFAREGLAFDGLPAELRLALTRLVFNPGKVSMKTRAQEILQAKIRWFDRDLKQMRIHRCEAQRYMRQGQSISHAQCLARNPRSSQELPAV